jgi:alcohol dehydrogenase class IV
VLPPVLRFSRHSCAGKLAALAIRAGVGESGEPEAVLAQKFLDSVESLNASLGIPARLDALREEDIPELAKAACWEADTNYPVPSRMSQVACEQLLRQILPVPRGPEPAARRGTSERGTPPRKGRARRRPAAG